MKTAVTHPIKSSRRTKKAIVSGDCNSVPTRAITKGEQTKMNDLSEAAIWSLWVPAQLARIEQQTGDLIASKLSTLEAWLKTRSGALSFL